MSGRITIALDAMGGDNAPDTVVRGANIARQRFPQVDFLLFGDSGKVEPLLRRYPALMQVSTIRHTPESIAADAKPSAALRGGRNSSMGLAIEAVKAGDAACVVSAGNTGALMALAMFALRTIPGIDRPAIASFFPTMRGESLMLDLGANVDCDADNLVQFALMGEVFARTALGIVHPTIGLLNVGEENTKGDSAVRGAFQRLRETKLPIRFKGFIEGGDIAAGTVDVIVTDGFTGNVALKTAEGAARLYSEFLRQAFSSSLMAKIGYVFARYSLGKLRVRLDPRRYNGAMFLGLNGITVKSHGSADALGFGNAIGVAVDMVMHGFNETIKREMEQYVAERDAAPKAAAS